MIPRLHLFELEDLSWFPTTIRDLATDYLQFIEHHFAIDAAATPVLAEALERTGSDRIVDLCSGGSGPLLGIVERLRSEGRDVRVTLTDRFPSLGTFARIEAETDGRVSSVPDPIDARAVPTELRGFRTVFNAFHHFTPSDARRVLRSAIEANEPIAIVEIPNRSWRALGAMFLTPLAVALATPRIRPFLWKRLFLTYVIPLVPLTCFWDGFVSQLRAYRREELVALAEEAGEGSGYTWEAREVPIPRLPVPLTVLIGLPERCGAPPGAAAADDAGSAPPVD